MDAETVARPITDWIGAPRTGLAAAPWLRDVPASTLDTLAAHVVLHRTLAGSMLFDQADSFAFTLLPVSGGRFTERCCHAWPRSWVVR
jgi:hypothetical protein